MTYTLRCHIARGVEEYEIQICNGARNRQASFLSALASRVAIITDDTVAPLYGEQLMRSLESSGVEVCVFSLPAGEQHKTRATKERLEDQLFDRGLGRDTCVVALGGGVVTDVAGYLAATYCRGVPLVMMPTSLLSMVDASIGGKTGVNVPQGKNLVGCIYQPKKVVIDPETLYSLPQRELANGVVEMIKHALIADGDFFDYLEKHVEALLALDEAALEKAIFESCRIKKAIVEEDEQEHGKRRLLNLGHSVAHALEKLTAYRLSHGEAVALGLLAEGHLALQLGALKGEELDRIRAILEGYGLPLRIPSGLSFQALAKAMMLDKKALRGQPRFVVIDGIGSCRAYGGDYCTPVDPDMLSRSLEWMLSGRLYHR